MLLSGSSGTAVGFDGILISVLMYNSLNVSSTFCFHCAAKLEIEISRLMFIQKWNKKI